MTEKPRMTFDEKYADILSRSGVRYVREEELGPDHIYVEYANGPGKDYDWAQELANPEFHKRGRLIFGVPIKDKPPAPINLVRHIIRENLSRPEIVAAYKRNAGVPQHLLEGQITLMLQLYGSYLRYKYTSLHDASRSAKGFTAGIFRGKYKGPDDPKLLEYMRSKRWYIEDDGVNYDR